MDVLGAALGGLLAASSLVVGALVALRIQLSRRVLGLVMAFGAGALISALSFELTEEAYSIGGADATAIGLGLGALTFYGGDAAIDRFGGQHRKRSGGQQAEGVSLAIVLGAVLDGIPESVVLGITFIGESGLSLAFLTAVLLSNFPEAMSASSGLLKAGYAPRRVIALWSLVAVVSAVAAAVGFAIAEGITGNLAAGIQAFAGGAILTMLADTMMPEAFEEGGPTVGLATVLGYTLAAGLSFLS